MENGGSPQTLCLAKTQASRSRFDTWYSFPTLINISLQEESFLVVKKDRRKTKVIIREQSDIDLALETLNASDSEEEITEVEPESDDEDTILDYSASDIENGDKKIFEDIENLDQDFSWILI